MVAANDFPIVFQCRFEFLESFARERGNSAFARNAFFGCQFTHRNQLNSIWKEGNGATCVAQPSKQFLQMDFSEVIRLCRAPLAGGLLIIAAADWRAAGRRTTGQDRGGYAASP